MQQEINTILGLMSGTSLDGLDIACVSFTENANGKPAYTLLAAETIPFSEEWAHRLREIAFASSTELIETDRALGKLFGEHCREFILKHQVNPEAIASHGHTVFHAPQRGFTLQIAHGAALAAASGLPVITDFRSTDVALGGQGAPLVPIGDSILFPDYEICLNLGGIANLSLSDPEGVLRAWDICPANQVLNHFVEPLGLSFDNKGQLASSGRLNIELLSELESLHFYEKTPPKSLGREWVDAELMPKLRAFQGDLPDLLHTFTHHIAMRLASDVHAYGPETGQILITGGGAFNDFLLETIKEKLGPSWEIVPASQDLIAFKEAIIFALLGWLRLRNRINTLASVTGAVANSSGGCIYLPI